MKGRLFDPSLIARAYRDPLSWVSLAVDLLPIVAVLAFGWGAMPLVALYWLENLVIGAFTIFRMLGTALADKSNLVAGISLSLFFTFHYGMFCFGHGVFLAAFSDFGEAPSPQGLIRWALGTAPEMAWFAGAVIVASLLHYAVDFIGRGEFRKVRPEQEMGAPYGRVITLHVAIIIGAAIALAFGQPLLAVLLLILIRVVFGIAMTVLTRRKRDALPGTPGVPA